MKSPWTPEPDAMLGVDTIEAMLEAVARDAAAYVEKLLHETFKPFAMEYDFPIGNDLDSETLFDGIHWAISDATAGYVANARSVNEEWGKPDPDREMEARYGF